MALILIPPEAARSTPVVLDGITYRWVVAISVNTMTYGLAQQAHLERQGSFFLPLLRSRAIYRYRPLHLQGIGDLATFGPGPGSQITPEMVMSFVPPPAHVHLCSDAAVARFAEQGWDEDPD
jgi:hypothetical protein